MISRRRLASQQIADRRFSRPADLVRWMGAVQAQDYAGGLWAIGLRLRPPPAESDVEDAIAAREIVRTWPMRGTLHFVPAADARWMLRLLAPRVIAKSAGRYRQLELDASAFARSRRILTRALEGGRRLTRPAAYAALARGGVSPEGQRGIHVLGHLAQEGLLCFGPREGRQPTFVLLDEWVPRHSDPSREEALAILATRYFAGHGPAGLADFAWWSGLLVKEAREAIALAQPGLRMETRDGRTWWSVEAPAGKRRPRPAVLLPPWDEYVVAYKDRDAALARLAGHERAAAAVGVALIVVAGTAVGAWRRALTPSAARVTLDFWARVTPAERGAARAAAAEYVRFTRRAVR